MISSLPACANSKFQDLNKCTNSCDPKAGKSIGGPKELSPYVPFVYPFKILERFICARVKSIIDTLLPHLQKQSDLWHGRSTIDQATFLTQAIEDSFLSKTAGAVFVILTAVYTTLHGIAAAHARVILQKADITRRNLEAACWLGLRWLFTRLLWTATLAPVLSTAEQARSQVSRFGGAQYIFRGARFCFYYMFKIKFSGRNKIWGHKKNFGGTAPEWSPWLRACSRGLHYYVVLQCSHPPHWRCHQRWRANSDWMPASFTSGQSSYSRGRPTR